MLKSRNCTAVKLCNNQIICLVPVNNNLYKKENIEIEELYGEDIMIIKRNCSKNSKEINRLRDYLEKEHPKINLITFDFYNLNIFKKNWLNKIGETKKTCKNKGIEGYLKKIKKSKKIS